METRQITLDFTSELNLRLAKIAALRDVRIDGLTWGRLDGVIELLKRLTIMCRERFGDLGDPYSVQVPVMGIAARLPRERIVTERTVRNWIGDAKQLGLIDVCYRSHERGGRNWNEFRVNFQRVLELLRPPVPCDRVPEPDAIDRVPGPDVVAQDGRQSPGGQIPDAGCQGPNLTDELEASFDPPDWGGNGRKRAETVSAPGAEIISAPKSKQITKQTTTPLPPNRSTGWSGGRAAAAEVGEVTGYRRQPATDVERLLAGVLSHWQTLAAEFETMGAEAVAEAIDTWRLNRERLKLGPGAIALFLRTGAWPAEGIVSREQLQQQALREAARKELAAQATRDQQERERRQGIELEARYGSLVDGLTDDDVRSIIGDNAIWRGVLDRHGRSDPAIRHLLLEHFLQANKREPEHGN